MIWWEATFMSDTGFAYVTGAGSGIGRACALALAQRGLAVAAVDVTESSAQETAELVMALGVDACAHRVDVTDAQSLEQSIASASKEFGPLVAAVNSAGLQGELAAAGDCSEANWLKIISVNLTGTFLSMRAQINAMLSGRGGSIVNIASNFGLVGQRGMPAYCASKHGVIGLSKSAVLDYADRGVRVNVVCPGPIGTPLLDSFLSNGGTEILDSIKLSVPMKRIGTSEEVAEAVAWLGSPETSYVTGAILSVDGGYVVP